MSIGQASSPSTVWDRVVCAVDFTTASVRAAREAALLMPAAAQLTLCAVGSPEAIEGGVLLEPQLFREAQDGFEQLQADLAPVHDAAVHLREGRPVRELLDELRAEQATLVAVGSRRHSRAAAIMLGSVAAAMLHEAPCSVLIAPEQVGAAGEIVVGFDGSGGARRAVGVGRELAGRLSLGLRVIVATGGRHPPDRGWSLEELGADLAVSEDPRPAVEALIDVSGSARLLVLGSRDLRGVMALFSVSERAAPRSGCPVLIVR